MKIRESWRHENKSLEISHNVSLMTMVTMSASRKHNECYKKSGHS
jgi:hypothetical protein